MLFRILSRSCNSHKCAPCVQVSYVGNTWSEILANLRENETRTNIHKFCSTFDWLFWYVEIVTPNNQISIVTKTGNEDVGDRIWNSGERQYKSPFVFLVLNRTVYSCYLPYSQRRWSFNWHWFSVWQSLVSTCLPVKFTMDISGSPIENQWGSRKISRVTLQACKWRPVCIYQRNAHSVILDSRCPIRIVRSREIPMMRNLGPASI